MNGETNGDVALSNDDRRNLCAAIELASQAVAASELPYGSLLVDPDGVVLAAAINTVTSSGDISAHPELKLASWASRTYPAERRTELILYTSCQPCLMCTNAIARAGLGRVVYALSCDQLHRLQPTWLSRPDAAPVRYAGPALFTAAAEPVRRYYDQAASTTASRRSL